MNWKQAEDGTWTAESVPLFGPGKWNGEEYNLEFCAGVVAASNASLEEIKPRLGIGHPPKDLSESERASWITQQPRMGLLRGFALKAKQIFADISQIPAKLKEQIDQGAWGPMSIEMKKGKLGWVIDRVGLLGLAAPAVPYAGVDAFAEDRLVFVLGETPEVEPQKVPEVVPQTVAPVVKPELPAGGEGGEMPDDVKAREDALAAERAKFEQEKEAQTKAYTEKQAALTKTKLETAWESIVGDNRAKPAERDSFMEIGEALNDAKVVQFAGTSGTSVDQHIASWKARDPMPLNKGKGKNEQGEETPVDVEEEILAFAEPLIEKGMTPSDAMAKWQEENPKRYAEYRKRNFLINRTEGGN